MKNMKESGIKWIGEIPEKWEVRKIKFLPNDEKDSFIDGDWIDSQYIEESGIRYYTTGNIGDGNFKEQGSGFISEDTFVKLKCKFAYPGDLIFSRLNAPYGRSCILSNKEDRCVLAVDNVILRTNNNKKYICYVTQCEGYHDAVGDFSNGATMQRISRINLGNVIIPLPEIKEQQLIADFLDNEVNKINDILNGLNIQVEILEKYKKSLITETVTKGLNSNVKMKDSGINWIGEIPENWEINKLKYISKCNEKTLKENTNNNYEFKYIDIGSVNYENGIENYQEMKFENAPSRARRIVEKGNTIISTVRTYLKAIAFIEDDNDVIVSTGFAVLNPTEELYNNKFFYYYIKSDKFVEQVDKYSYGITYPAINTELLTSIYAVIPPITEQKKIVDYLDKKCAQIDEIINDKQTQIEKMEKYKKSLIYEYVTGKKRLKGAEELYV